ncbi:MFS transporter [Streptomyces sp. SID3343]|uniref:MFS transporter n=1 Tax=Streptomyces sp. SID3343 TaxID=2690260 RepID=UPI0031F72B88
METEPAQATTLAEPQARPAYRLRWIGLAVVMGADIMDLLDATIVNVAGPGIRDSLGGSTAHLQWFSAAYTLVLAMFLIAGARLGDIFGRRRMFLGGVAAFTVASALCALAQSPEMLIGARGFQGLTAAMMVPQAFGLIRDMFDERDMGMALAVFGPAMGLSAVLGPILGGILLDADLFGLGWRSVFLVNVPLGVFAFFAGSAVVPRPTAEQAAARKPRLDLIGTLLVTAAMVLLVYPLVQGREEGWPAWTYASMAASLPVLAAFAWYELRTSRAGRDALVEISLFGNRAFTGALVVGLAIFGSMIGLMLVLGVYLQVGLGWTATHAALALIPWSLGSAVGAGLAGAVLGPKYGRLVLHAGLVIGILGVVGIGATVALHDGPVNVWLLLPATGVAGLGFGLLLAPFFDIALAGVADHEIGSASGVLNAVQQLAGALGVALLGTLFFTHVEDNVGGAHGADAVRAVFDDALTLGLVGSGLALAAAWALTFLMPRKARADAGAAH